MRPTTDVGPTRSHVKTFPGERESTKLKLRVDTSVTFICPQTWLSVMSRLIQSTGRVKRCLVLKFCSLQDVSPADLPDNFKEENRVSLYYFFGLQCEVFYGFVLPSLGCVKIQQNSIQGKHSIKVN